MRIKCYCGDLRVVLVVVVEVRFCLGLGSGVSEHITNTIHQHQQ